MYAEAVPLHKILNSNLQMIIPIFQRDYSWKGEQVRILWEDISKLYKNTEKKESFTHFLGPIVKLEVSQSSVDTRKFYLIDGQQRIITLMVLLSCLRNIVKKDELLRKIEAGYLLNYQEKGENRYKLVPSEGDRNNFKKIIDGDMNLLDSKLKDTFNFFTKELKSYKNESDLEKLRGIIINHLFLVNIDVGRNEDPYLIFESLNAKGTPLTQADLIKNYIFMKIQEEEKQKKLYKEYWRPMEISLRDGLEWFFWKYSLREGTFVKIKRTYANLKSELETNNQKNAETELKKLYKFSVYCDKMLSPEKEPNEELRKRFIRYNRWEINTSYPFLFNLYEDYSNNKISVYIFCEILDIIESFVIRRFFCKEPTNKLNNLFIRLYKKLDKNNLIRSLKKELSDDCPDNEKFEGGLKTFPIYSSGSEKCSLILETLEESHRHKEPVKFDKIQIEHIMPQADGDPEKLLDEWKNMLGEDYVKVHSECLHRIGNLTLTGYNQEMGMKSFSQKKEKLKDSHFELNKYFDNLNKWDRDEIEKRANIIAKKAVEIWKIIK